jgi:hypothetical protein
MMARAMSSWSSDGRRRTASIASSRSFVIVTIYGRDGSKSRTGSTRLCESELLRRAGGQPRGKGSERDHRGNGLAEELARRANGAVSGVSQAAGVIVSVHQFCAQKGSLDRRWNLRRRPPEGGPCILDLYWIRRRVMRCDGDTLCNQRQRSRSSP